MYSRIWIILPVIDTEFAGFIGRCRGAENDILITVATGKTKGGANATPRFAFTITNFVSKEFTKIESLIMNQLVK